MSKITIEQRLNNLSLMKGFEQEFPEMIDEFVNDHLQYMNQEEVSFILQDSIMGTFKDKKTGEPFKLSTKTMQKLMLYKIDQFVEMNSSENIEK